MNSGWVRVSKVTKGAVLFPLKCGWAKLEEGGVVSLLEGSLVLTPEFMRELCEMGCIVEVAGVPRVERELLWSLEELRKRSGLNQCGQLV